MALNTSSLICAEAEKECLPLAPLPEVNGKPRHRRTLLEQEGEVRDMGDLYQVPGSMILQI
ncbi:MAG: hypothetical protein NT128_01235 [Proteobacteria bacterium]|nr:hypothetical protein [Pseudomonadota bacterium]